MTIPRCVLLASLALLVLGTLAPSRALAFSDREKAGKYVVTVDGREVGVFADCIIEEERGGGGTLTLQRGVVVSSFAEWLREGSERAKRKISIIKLKQDGSEARRWDVHDAFPSRWDPGEYSPSSNVATETVVCKMGRVELG